MIKMPHANLTVFHLPCHTGCPDYEEVCKVPTESTTASTTTTQMPTTTISCPDVGTKAECHERCVAKGIKKGVTMKGKLKLMKTGCKKCKCKKITVPA